MTDQAITNPAMTDQKAACKNLLFLVPMKDPNQAKSRLSAVLSDATRQRLALSLYRQTLRFLRDFCAHMHHAFACLVVTNSYDVADLANGFGIKALQQSDDSGLNGAVAFGCDWAKQNGYRSVCILPADLADHDRGEFVRLLDCERPERSVIICPSQDQGTNALLITPPDALPPCYGPRSFHRHLGAAKEAGLHAVILPLEGISHDIDSAEDLAGSISPTLHRALGTDHPASIRGAQG
ncbi:MAG: 2-phospho-L-lactate guanylyltransferase [Cohaesibacter sp.]|nr:2-phospho-L-lactate guanylyltransferase [Cohaesibacter sp.]